MKTSRFAGIFLVGLLGCGPIYGPGPATPTHPQMPAEPVGLSGPPGGADPGYDQQHQQQIQDPGGDQQGYANDVEATQPDGPAPADPYLEPSTDPNSSGYVMGNVTDSEINSTLAPYGNWVEDEEYGRVWRPNTTVVGADFTPYDTGGTWVYTDAGWTFNCADWGWGWLPFHYGAWDWIGGAWGWVPGYGWGPGWVDWRYGNGYVGWRPSRPHGRDYNNNRPDRLRDHRRAHNNDWRFSHERDFGRRGSQRVAPADGLRATREVTRPGVRPTSRTSVASVMGTRLNSRAGGTVNRQQNPYRPSGRYDQRGTNTYRQPYRSNQPSYTQHPDRGYQRPSTPGTADGYQRPRPSYQQPQQPRWQRDQQGTWRREPSNTYQPNRTYQQPNRTYQQPNRTYQQPNRTYQQPNRTYQQPSHTAPTRSAPSTRPSAPASRPSSSSSSRPSSSSSSSKSSSSSSSSSSKSSSSSSSSSSRGSSSSGRR